MRNRRKLMVTLAAALLLVTVACGGADPVSPRVWAAATCDAFVSFANEVKELTDRTRKAQDPTWTAAEKQRAFFVEFFPDYVKLLRSTTEAIVAIGPPDVEGGPEWHAEIVDYWESTFDEFDAITAQMVDDVAGLPMTPASGEAERELMDRYGERLQELTANSGLSSQPRELEAALEDSGCSQELEGLREGLGS